MTQVRVLLPTLFLTVFVLVGSARSLNLPPDAGTFRFLVSLSHPEDNCLEAVDAARSFGDEFLSQCDWGCVGGDHTCYVILVGDDEVDVRKSLPREWNSAKITKLIRFSPEQVDSFHRN